MERIPPDAVDANASSNILTQKQKELNDAHPGWQADGGDVRLGRFECMKARQVTPPGQMHESYFVRKTADYARAREWARLGCAWGGTHKRAHAFFCPGPAQKNVLGSIFGSAREAAHRRRQTTIFF